MFDTNVLISGYLWKGLARRALERVRSGNWTLLVSKDAIDELIRVLAYNKFGLKPEEIEPLINDLTKITEFVEVRTKIQAIKDDPTDNIFLTLKSLEVFASSQSVNLSVNNNDLCLQRGIYSNAQMGTKDIKRHCVVKEGAERLLEMAINKLGLSARAYSRILKVGRTIADLETSEEIEPAHISEAIQYRSLDRKTF